MKHEQVPARTDLEDQQPIATDWRGPLREVVGRFVRGDSSAAGIPGVAPVSAETAKQMQAYVAHYGETLIELPEEAWATSVACWYGDHGEALVDLWTAESGCSDMVLDVSVFERADGFRFELHLVYVPERVLRRDAAPSGANPMTTESSPTS